MDQRSFLIRGEHTGIRRLRRDDGPAFVSLARQSAELHHPWLYPPVTDAAFDSYASRVDGVNRESIIVCELETGALAGWITMNNIVRGAFQCATFGYGAFARLAGRGHMTEGLGLTVRYAFENLGLHRVEVNIQPGNTRSLALVKKNGFRREGFSPDFLYIDGAWRDHERWAITTEMVAEARAERQ